MTRSARTAEGQPSVLQIGAGVLFGIDFLIVGGTVAPGLLLCVPAIVLVVTPLIALGVALLLAALALALAASPVVLAVAAVRTLRRRHQARIAAAPQAARVPAPAPVAGQRRRRLSRARAA